MKKLACLAVLLVFWGDASGGGEDESATGKTNDLTRVPSLIQYLGAKDFSTRSNAEIELSQYSREILPILEKHVDTPDPEVQLRVNRVINHLKWHPSKIPQSVWLFNRESQLPWNSSVAAWRAQATASVDHPGTNASPEITCNYESMAQSFVPLCTNIAAIQISVYPLREKDEWFRVDVRDDDNDRPGRYVLTRAWIRVDGDLPTDRISLLPFDVPDLAVVSNRIYWIVYTALRGPANPAINGAALRFSQVDSYKSGRCLFLAKHDNYKPTRTDCDLLFCILSDCSSVPLLRKASKEEQEAVPNASKFDKHWED